MRFVSTVAFFAVLSVTCALAQDATAPKLAATCQSCHGPRGDSPTPTTPRLNGQSAAYIAQRLRDFRDPTRQDPHAVESMWSVMTQVDDASIPVLAAYFASQTPTLPQNHGALAAKGGKLFAEGALPQKVPACQACHGAHGEGNGTTPRLAGQRAAYLTHQLEVLRLSLRESDVMHPKTNEMTDEHVKSLPTATPFSRPITTPFR